ncbi:MAG: hypothetical protein [Cressdnaviricota sp.]|nr:MAG: hypothetical protein [Cressdnaviricota sp.]
MSWFRNAPTSYDTLYRNAKWRAQVLDPLMEKTGQLYYGVKAVDYVTQKALDYDNQKFGHEGENYWDVDLSKTESPVKPMNNFRKRIYDNISSSTGSYRRPVMLGVSKWRRAVVPPVVVRPKKRFVFKTSKRGARRVFGSRRSGNRRYGKR